MNSNLAMVSETLQSNRYYADKLPRLAALLGATKVSLKENGLDVDGKFYPIIDDVIIFLDPSQYPASVHKKLGAGTTGEKTEVYAPDIQDHYSKFWKEWSGLHSRYEEEFEGYFDLVDLKSLEGARVCDLGCGMGRWSYMLAQKTKVSELVLVDFSDALFTARKLFINDSRAIFLMADLLKLPFPPNSFDFSMSLGVLHHLPADCLDIVRKLKPLSPRFLVYLYYALDNKPSYYRLLLQLYTPIRKLTCKIKSEIIRNMISWLALLVCYLPFIALGYLLKPFGLSKYVPLFDEHHWAGIGGMRHSAYDRFFTRIEQRVSRKQIAALEDTFDKVTIAPGQAFWHFLCESRP